MLKVPRLQKLPHKMLLFLWLFLGSTVLIFSTSNPALATAPSITLDWDLVAPQPYRVLEGQGAAVGNYYYSFGGYDSTNNKWIPTVRAYVFNPVANTWTRISDMPYNGVTHGATATDGQYVYIAGGYPPNGSGTAQLFATNRVIRYDPQTDTYSDMPNLPGSRGAGIMVYAPQQHALHFIGGTDINRAERTEHWKLDLNNTAAGWVTRAALPAARNHAGGIYYNGNIYYIGGQVGQDGPAVPHDDMQIYNIANNSWSVGADLPDLPRHHITLSNIVIDNKIVIIGGERAWSQAIQTVIAYDPANNSYEYLRELPDPNNNGEMSGVAFIIGNYLYYTGGNSTYTFRSPLNLQPEADLYVSMTTPNTWVNNGANVPFTITIENTGDFTFSSINITGSSIGSCNTTIQNLLVDDSTTYTCTKSNVAAPFTNTINISATASNGSVITDSKSIDVTIVPGHITIVKEATPANGQSFAFSGTNGIGAFNLSDNDISAPATVNAHVNFQSVGAIIPPNYVADTGAAFDNTRGYGWIREDSVNGASHVPLNITGNGRDRQNFNTDQRYDTIMHMQYTGTNGVATSAAWEYNLPNGVYTVTLSVGDQPPYDSIHVINVEGQRIINGFIGSDNNEYRTVTLQIPVLDGRLTIDAIGGTNTKINYVDIAGTPTPPNGRLFQSLAPGTYNITETVPNDWTLENVTCTGGGTSLTNNGVIANVNSGSNIVCTFTNRQNVAPTIQQIAPVGTLTSSLGDPTYQWSTFPNATSYALYVAKSDNSQIINLNLSYTSANCTAVNCAVDLTELSESYRLTNGNYNWYVRPIINGVAGTWVGPQAFTLNVPAPSLVTLGTTTGTETLRPTFHWTLTGNAIQASYFSVYLQDGNGFVRINDWFGREQVCGSETGTTCSLQAPLDLPDETNYTLYILSYGAGGYSTGGPYNNGYAGPESFRVSVPKPQPISPSGVVNLPLGNPLYTWTDIAGATYYYLYVANSAGQQVINEVLSDAGYCNGTQCQVDMTTIRETYRLTAGIYTFYVRGYIGSTATQTPWSNPMTFNINSSLPGLVTKLSPEMGSNEAGPNVTFTWEQVPNAIGYEVTIMDPNGVATVHRGVTGNEIACAAGECSWTFTLSGIPGIWSWYAHAFNAVGDGAWSPANSPADNYGGFEFTMPIPLPELVNKLSPAGTVNTDLLTFTWDHQAVASAYEIYITGPSGYVYYQTRTVGTDITCTTTCALPLQLPYAGNYIWYVRGVNAVGTGDWGPDEANGDYAGYTVNVNLTLPAVIAKIAPAASSTLDNLAVQFSWQPDVNATRYELYITGPNGYANDQQLIVGQGVTCTTNCQASVTLPANGAYSWYVRGGNAAGWGNWSPLNGAADNFGGVAFSVNMVLPDVIAKVAPTANQNFTTFDVNFEWIHDPAATRYQLYITGPNSYVRDQTYTVGQGITCATNCAITVTLPINGNYMWYVRGGNAAGLGKFSPLNSAADGFGGVAFTLGQPLPAVIAKIAPAASATLDNLAVQFSWQPDANATRYELYITGPSFTYNQQLTVGQGVTCTSTCAITLNLPANGAYLWYVRGGNAAGMGKWSPLNGAADNFGGIAFTVNMAVPGLVEKVSPAAASTSTTLDVPFVWTTLSGATRYELYVTGPNSFAQTRTYIVGQDITCTDTCSKTVTVPANGTYLWYVRAGNAAGMGNWSPLNSAADNYGGVQFLVAVQVPVAPALVSPVNDAVIYQTNRPTFQWNTVSNATYYHLEIRNGLNTVVFDQWLQNTTVCNAGTCTYQLVNPIAYGGYTWRMQSYNVAGVGAWSNTRSFLSLSANLQPLMVQVEDGLITRSGTWTAQSSERALGQSYLQSSNSTADTLTMSFTGTALDVIYVAGPQYGTFVVEIDGEPLRGVNANAAALAFGQVASFTDLAEGEHTLRIVPLGGAPVAIDALIVNGEVIQNTPDATETPVAIDPTPEETPVVIPVNPTDETPTEEVITETPVVINPTPETPTETPTIEATPAPTETSGAETTPETTAEAGG